MGRNKKQIFDTIKDILNNKDGFAYRVCKILQDGEFDRPLSSQELTRLLNDGPGRKIKATNLTALMEPLLKREIIKTKMIGGTRGRRRLWFPGWLDKSQVSTIEVSLDQVHFFSGINSWSDPNKNFPKIIKSLKGDLMIVDPYYGNGTFFVLEKFGKDRRIRFITSQLGREEQQKRDIFDNNFQRFKKEFKKIEFRRLPDAFELHDRYIVADNALVIVGQGLKDLGKKESFVVYLPLELTCSFIPTLRKVFEERWKRSQKV